MWWEEVEIRSGLLRVQGPMLTTGRAPHLQCFVEVGRPKGVCIPQDCDWMDGLLEFREGWSALSTG